MTKNRRVIYDDDDWVIEIVENEIPHLKISGFKNFHFVEEIDITMEMLESDLIDKFKDLFYK